MDEQFLEEQTSDEVEFHDYFKECKPMIELVMVAYCWKDPNVPTGSET